MPDGDHQIRAVFAEVAHDALQLVVADALELRDRRLVDPEAVGKFLVGEADARAQGIGSRGS